MCACLFTVHCDTLQKGTLYLGGLKVVHNTFHDFQKTVGVAQVFNSKLETSEQYVGIGQKNCYYTSCLLLNSYFTNKLLYKHQKQIKKKSQLSLYALQYYVYFSLSLVQIRKNHKAKGHSFVKTLQVQFKSLHEPKGLINKHYLNNHFRHHVRLSFHTCAQKS